MFRDSKVEAQMHLEGKILVEGFAKMVEEYFKNKYGKIGNFEFLYTNYEYYDEDYQVYNVDIGDYVVRPENRKVQSLLPFFIEPGVISDIRSFCLEIPGIIDRNNLDSEIKKRLPEGVIFINQEEMAKIFLNAGYTDYFFDHYMFSMMDYPAYNVYAKPSRMLFGGSEEPSKSGKQK